MLIGCFLGLINGALVAYGGVPAIIVTLGTLAIYRTWLIDHANAKTITADSLPQWLIDLPQKTVLSVGDLDLRLVFVVAVVVVLLLQWGLARLRWGRQLYAIGSNPEAASQAGLPRQRLVLLAFAGSGTLAGLGGFLFLARFGTITVAAGQGLELQSIAGAVVGGVSIGGGSGTLFGALLGAILIDLLNQSLARVPQISEFWRDAILGTLILLAVDRRCLGQPPVPAPAGRRVAASRRPLAALDTRKAPDRCVTWVRAAQLGGPARRDPRRHRRDQHQPVVRLPRRRQLREPLPAVDREGDRRGDHGLHHHQRRDRPVGRVGDGASRPVCSRGFTTRARCRSRSPW